MIIICIIIIKIIMAKKSRYIQYTYLEMANNFHILFHTNQFRMNIHWGENISHVQYIPKFHFLREIYTLERNITFCYWSNLASKLSVHRHHKYKFYYAVENEIKKLMIYFSISIEVQILPSIILKSNQTTYFIFEVEKFVMT